MLTRTNPPATIVVDATAQDTGHRTRGIGRYAGALWRAMAALDPDVVALRLTSATRSWRAAMPDRHLLRFVRAQGALAQELERNGCTVFGATEPWMLPRSNERLRVVPTCHDVIPLEFAEHYRGWNHAKWSIYFRWIRSTRALERCPAIIVPSEATRTALERYMDVDPDWVTVIPHGIDHRRFFPAGDEAIARARTRLGIGSEPYVLYVGGFDYRKNIAGLVEGFGLSGESENMLLVLAGPASSNERAAILEAAHRAGVGRRLVWVGRVGDAELNGLYSGAEAFLYPSLSEGFGLQVLEAMACGCPVITSDRSALREVAGDAAILVDPERAEAIGAALAALDSDRQQHLRALGVERAGHYDWTTTARQTLELYRSVAAA